MQVQAINASMPARQANFGNAGKAANMAIAGLFTAASTAGAHAPAPMEKAANKVLPGIESQAFFASNISKDGKVVSNFRPSEIQPVKTAELNAKAPVKALSNYYGIPKENIRAEYDFSGGGRIGDNKSYKALLVYSKNSVNKGTNYVDEIYFVPRDMKEGETPYKVEGIVSVTANDGSTHVGYMVEGRRYDDYDMLGVDYGVILPKDEAAYNILYLITNNEKSPYPYVFVNGNSILGKGVERFGKGDVYIAADKL